MIGFDLSQEQIALQDMARKFSVQEIRPKAAAYDRDGTFPADILDAVHEHVVPLPGHKVARDCSVEELMRRNREGI